LIDDPSIQQWIAIQLRLLILKLRQLAWCLNNNPDLPWVRWAIGRRADKIAAELLKLAEDSKNRKL
jgi:hypothetical protein